MDTLKEFMASKQESHEQFKERFKNTKFWIEIDHYDDYYLHFQKDRLHRFYVREADRYILLYLGDDANFLTYDELSEEELVKELKKFTK